MACTLSLTILGIFPPTSAGGWGMLAFRISGGADLQQLADVRRVSDGVQVQALLSTGNGDYSFAIPPFGVGVDLEFTVYEDVTYDPNVCQTAERLVVPGFSEPVDPSLTEAPRWEPVGGVLPNPVLLQVEATLLSAGAARPGLHVEVELWRPAAVTAFATLRATIREATQYVDTAPYLRAELRALQRYAAGLSAPFIDQDASLRFTYRYRVVDKAGAEPWVKREGPRYAVLAALAGPADTMGAYVADTTGTVASIFDDYEATQFVGYPQEASVLLPPAGDTPRWAELRYLDAWGAAVEIRSYALASTLPAGMLRIPLPDDPPMCAAAVEVSVRDDNRAFAGTCGHVVPAPPVSTSGLYSDPLYGTY